MPGLHRHPENKGVMYTDGVEKLCSGHPFYKWMLEMIVSRQKSIPFSNHSFQEWHMTSSYGMGHLYTTVDDEPAAIWSYHIHDCISPVPKIKWVLDNGTISLPWEFDV